VTDDLDEQFPGSERVVTTRPFDFAPPAAALPSGRPEMVEVRVEVEDHVHVHVHVGACREGYAAAGWAAAPLRTTSAIAATKSGRTPSAGTRKKPRAPPFPAASFARMSRS
jgi:hypothetical protein